MDGEDPGCDQQRPLDQVPERVALDGVAHGLAEHFGCGVQRECHRSPPLFRPAVPNRWSGRPPGCSHPGSGTTDGGVLAALGDSHSKAEPETTPNAFAPNCLVAERCWDQVRWAIEAYAWRFEPCANPARVRRS